MRIPCHKRTKRLVRKICDQNLHAAANTTVKHSEVYSAVLTIVKENTSDKMSDYLKSLGMLLQYLLNKPHERVFQSNLLWWKEDFLPLGLLLLMYMFVGSWTTSQPKFPLKWPLLFDPLQWTNHKENTVFFQNRQNTKKSTFPKSCGERRAASWKSFVLVAIGD